METFLEIMKFTIPGMVVFATAYYMLKLYTENQQQLTAMAQRQEAMKVTLPLRLQAYERLMLLCDRVILPNMLFRLRLPGMKVGELKNVLLLTIQQEFDHNTSQQLYVSETLWQIMSLARQEAAAAVVRAADGLDAQADCEVLVQAILREHENGASLPQIKAASAVRTEAGKLF